MQPDSQKSPNLPLVSVIIPAYNAEKFIEETLKSVLAQTYPQIEVLVVDDGSQDRTPEIVEKIAQKDPRVQLLKQPNAGVAAARNLGIQKSIGEYIAPIDADDIWYPENIEKQVKCMMAGGPSLGVVYSWSLDIDEKGFLTGGFRAFTIEGEVYKTLVCHNFLGNASASMIRRSALDKVGFYESNYREQSAQGCEDWDLYLRLAEYYQYQVVPEFLIGYRKVYSSMSSNYMAMAKSHALMLQDVKQRHPEIPEFLYRFSASTFLISLAHQSSRNGSDSTALFWLFQALKAECISPLFRFGFYRILAKSLLNLLFQFWRHQDALEAPLRLQEPPSSECKLTSREVLVESRCKNIELMVTIGNIFHRSISRIVKRNQADIATARAVRGA
ncbi:glycosyltransferase family 2 protein [Kamptonema sp. UHCC 0994]|uniref:glycosyltransferase family 2 protein n=1 Tax=Kamptonema sp. UHCC 0994 TaxID=3031329 RepID=UPI0023BA185F|nr:glycosyltransferase family 2 protein [Kamptonema sp. UHCC 0994]MDF0551858.1 glycosyltransferase family 2 protein [Kamptonema sp. UHCC 0994]